MQANLLTICDAEHRKHNAVVRWTTVDVVRDNSSSSLTLMCSGQQLAVFDWQIKLQYADHTAPTQRRRTGPLEL